VSFLHVIRAAVIKNGQFRRDDRRNRNAIMASGTEVQDDSYVRGRTGPSGRL
jgi:hypothetical protein